MSCGGYRAKNRRQRARWELKLPSRFKEQRDYQNDRSPSDARGLFWAATSTNTDLLIHEQATNHRVLQDDNIPADFQEEPLDLSRSASLEPTENEPLDLSTRRSGASKIDTPRVEQADSPQSGRPPLFQEDPQAALITPEQEQTDPTFVRLYREKWPQIRSHFNTGNAIRDRYNFRLAFNNDNDLREMTTGIFQDQRSAFKINLSFGFILLNNESGELRYFYPHDRNNAFLDAPMLIENVADMERFLQAITEIDILEIARQARPDSKWVVHILTNVTFYVDKLTDHPIGAFDELPDFIRHSRAIIGLDSGAHGQYKDNLCFFRCLAVHRAGAWHRNIEKPAKELFQAYLEFSGKTRKEFKGVTLGELTVLEALFHTNIYVYSLRKDTDGSVFAELVRRPVMKFQDTMYLNLYANHLSYIKDFNSYSKSWSCQVCSRKFTHHGHLMVHQRQCTGSTSFVYPGGAFQLTSNIFDKLQDEGVSIPREQRIYPYRVTWDIECLLKPLAEQNSEKMTWEAVHELLSVSVSSNVPGFTTPKCFVSDGEPKVVADDFLAYIEQISHHAYKTLRETFGWVFDEILDKRQKDIEQMEQEERNKPPLDRTDKDSKLKKHYLTKMLEELEKHLRQIPAYECQEMKGVFPYEWMDDLSKLEQTSLPPADAFYSKLRGTHISPEDYAHCQAVWEECGMETMKDFLIWYNNKDVQPMLEAIQKMVDFYKDLGLDMLKDGISVPGLTLKYLFKNLGSDTFFTLPDNEENVDISIDDIGDHMKQYAETHGVMSRPRRSLIGSMFGQKILLATPLLKWYLEKGLVVEHIYQVLEYIPKKCFEPFVEAVSNARREGDRDDRKKVIAETMKLIDVSDFQYCEMDTDSAYIAISADRLEDVIKPHMRERYENEKHLWFPRTDTPENAAYDKRTPEYQESLMTELSSKLGPKIQFQEGLPGNWNDVTKPGCRNAIVIDDQMEEVAKGDKSPRDQSMVTTLAKQMFPGHSKFLQECYEDAVNKKTHGHLFLDLHPESPIELRVRSGMLTPQPYVYLRK
ncbi:hypothetical protein Bbelb_037680 [Branchiostoma belcheri]|nr:hypothetical protein Bbelb_037680 [Branchiostoma belcheri]